MELTCSRFFYFFSNYFKSPFILQAINFLLFSSIFRFISFFSFHPQLPFFSRVFSSHFPFTSPLSLHLSSSDRFNTLPYSCLIALPFFCLGNSLLCTLASRLNEIEGTAFLLRCSGSTLYRSMFELRTLSL